MVTQFQRGQKAKLSDLTLGTDLYVGVQISGPGLTFDISCFGLDAEERLSDDRYFIFYNQTKSPEEALQLLGPQAGDTESFRVTLDRVPARITRLAFTATIDGAGTMSQVAPGYLRLVAGGEECEVVVEVEHQRSMTVSSPARVITTAAGAPCGAPGGQVNASRALAPAAIDPGRVVRERSSCTAKRSSSARSAGPGASCASRSYTTSPCRTVFSVTTRGSTKCSR